MYAPIECEMASFSLGSCPSFTALSYTLTTLANIEERFAIEGLALFNSLMKSLKLLTASPIEVEESLLRMI